MRPDDKVRISHIMEAANDIESFVRGTRKEDLIANRMLLLAVTRAVEIITEAASRISAETKAEIPEVPWSVIYGMRNRLVHAYFDVDVNVLWDTATRNVPALVRMLKARGY